MTDSTTNKPIRVSDGGTPWPNIVVPTSQLDRVRTLLESNRIRFWVDHQSISFDGKPPVSFVNLGRDTDADRVQALLDSVA